MTALHTRRSELIMGIRDTLPLQIGSVPFGLIYGALAVNSGLSPALGMALSVFVFGGSSQVVGVGLVTQGAGLAVIIFTTFIINARHALYGATLAPYMKHLPQRWLLPLGFLMTDGTFVLVMNRYKQSKGSPFVHWYYLGSGLISYLSWNLWTFVGVAAGQRIPDLSQYGLSFAVDATFITMIIPQLTNSPMLMAALAAGLSAVAFHDMPNKLGLLAAVCVGSAVGLIAEHLMKTEPIMPSAKGTPDERQTDE